MTSDALWKYVSVRRLFIFLERSIDEGTQWMVFEPNDERLWSRVIDTIRLFLRGQWRLGALFGRTEQEAFFIKCDRTTMTQDDILNGRLICEGRDCGGPSGGVRHLPDLSTYRGGPTLAPLKHLSSAATGEAPLRTTEKTVLEHDIDP